MKVKKRKKCFRTKEKKKRKPSKNEREKEKENWLKRKKMTKQKNPLKKNKTKKNARSKEKYIFICTHVGLKIFLLRWPRSFNTCGVFEQRVQPTLPPDTTFIYPPTTPFNITNTTYDHLITSPSPFQVFSEEVTGWRNIQTLSRQMLKY